MSAEDGGVSNWRGTFFKSTSLAQLWDKSFHGAVPRWDLPGRGTMAVSQRCIYSWPHGPHIAPSNCPTFSISFQCIATRPSRCSILFARRFHKNTTESLRCFQSPLNHSHHTTGCMNNKFTVHVCTHAFAPTTSQTFEHIILIEWIFLFFKRPLTLWIVIYNSLTINKNIWDIKHKDET